jgi:hypothetical protein
LTEEKKKILKNLVVSLQSVQSENFLTALILEMVCEKTSRIKILAELNHVPERSMN